MSYGGKHPFPPRFRSPYQISRRDDMEPLTSCLLILITLSYSFTAQYEANGTVQCVVSSESECALKEFTPYTQYYPPVESSSGSPGCIIDWQYTSYSRGHMTLCTDECVADKVYDCSNIAQCACNGKGNYWSLCHDVKFSSCLLFFCIPKKILKHMKLCWT